MPACDVHFPDETYSARHSHEQPSQYDDLMLSYVIRTHVLFGQIVLCALGQACASVQ